MERETRGLKKHGIKTKFNPSNEHCKVPRREHLCGTLNKKMMRQWERAQRKNRERIGGQHFNTKPVMWSDRCGKEMLIKKNGVGEGERFIHPYRVGVTFWTWLWNRTAEEHSHTYAHTQDWHTNTLHTNALFDGRLGDRTGACTQAHTHNNQAGSGALKTSLCDVQSSGICVHGERQRERRSGGERKKNIKRQDSKLKNHKNGLILSQNSPVLLAVPTAEMDKSTGSKGTRAKF